MRSAIVAVVLAAVAGVTAVGAPPAAAVPIVPFTVAFNAKLNGGVLYTGNGVLTCDGVRDNGVSDPAGCTAARQGTNPTAGLNNNNSWRMQFVDIDSDAATYNSSSADLVLPPGSQVVWAGLYWGGKKTGANGLPGAPAPLNQMLLQLPGSASYTTITADEMIEPSAAELGGDLVYQGFAEITAEVGAAGGGTYTAANVAAARGSDRYGGWTLVTVFEDRTRPLRDITVFDGFSVIRSGAASETITISGFVAPVAGPVDATIGLIAYEGDRGSTGDRARLNGVTLSDAASPADNFFNSTIESFGANVTTRAPSDVNLLGFDSKVANVGGIIPNSATSATIELRTGGETYYPAVVTTRIDLTAPAFPTTPKRVVNLNGNDPAGIGDVLEYTITETNLGDDPAEAVVLTDVVPAGTTYLAGSLRTSPDGTTFTPRTDAPGDDVAEFDAGTGELRFRLGAGASAASGGTIAPGATGAARFLVQINDGSAGTTVENTAHLAYHARTVNQDFTAPTNTVTTPVARLDVEVVVDPPIVIPPHDVDIDIDITNPLPDPATEVIVDIPAPPGVVITEAIPSQGSCEVTATGATCDLGDLAPGASASIDVTATITTSATGCLTLNVPVTSGQGPVLGDGNAIVCVAPERPPSRFVALTPARILDTRTQNPQVGYSGPKPGAGTVIDLQVTGRGGVPETRVTAVVMNVTATESAADGFVTVWPTGEAMPLASNLNARPEARAPVGEQAVPNLVTVPVSVDGKVSLFTQSGTDLLADVAGYYEAVSLTAEGRLMPLPEPARVLDTRPQNGQVGYSGAKPGPGDTVNVAITGNAGVPATGASAVVLNVTATEATERGFVTVFAGGGPLPWASNLNVEYAGQTVPNQVVVPLGADGSINVYTQSGTHLLADVAGWFTGPTDPLDTTGLFVPVSPERNLDTRSGGGPVPGGGTVAVPVASGQIPATGVGAVIANVTATEAAAPGFVTAYPAGSMLPWASNLNIERAGQTIPNHVTVGVSAAGFNLYTLSGTHLVADFYGWYMA